MRRETLRHLIRVAAVLVLGIAAGGVCVAAEFSADEITKHPGQSSTEKIYVKGTKIRQEKTMMDGWKMISISRPDKKVLWMLDPARKTYSEHKFGAKDFGGKARMSNGDRLTVTHVKDMGVRKLVGKETVNGYACDKYSESFKDKKRGTMHVWVAKKLNWPIKFDQKGGRFSMQRELKNIKEGGVKDSMFEIPKGYKKTTAEGMFGGGHRGPHGMPPGMPHGMRRGMPGMPPPPR